MPVNPAACTTDKTDMPSPLLAAYLVFGATLARALLVKARLAPPTCTSCGLPLERHRMGDPVCRCDREATPRPSV